MGACLRYARALAGYATGRDVSPSIVDVQDEIENEMPTASDAEIYREALSAAAVAIAGDDADAWHLLLFAFVVSHAARLLELRDGDL